MSFKIEKIENEKEKIIMTGLIVSDEYCNQIVPIFQRNTEIISEIFSSFSKIVCRWCLDYYKKYKKAPKKLIQKIFDQKKEIEDIDQIDLIEEFLTNLSDNYSRQDNFNEQFIIDQSVKYLREVSIKNLELKIKICRKNGNIDEAEKLVNQFKEINKDTKNYEVVDFLEDDEEIKEALYKKEDRLFKLPGDLGKLLGYFLRGDLISFIAPGKRGKSVVNSTLILMWDGSSKTMGQIYQEKKNEFIISLNENNYKLEKDRIIDWIFSGRKNCIKIMTKTGRNIECALTHPFLHFSNGWIESKNLNIGDFICCFDNNNIFWDKIEKIEDIGVQECYDIEVEKNHNYISDNIVSHNSWYLLYCAARALLSRLRVLIFSFEMTKTQIIKRLLQSFMGELSQNDEQLDELKEVRIPYFFYNEDKEKYEIKYKTKVKTGLNYKEINIKIKAIKDHLVKNGSLKIICAPMNSMTTSDISKIIDDMVLDGFVPDVIVSDYADITLSTEKGEHRHKLDDIWKGYKNIALSKHIVVITATHSNKSTYNSDIGQGDASDDIRKMNHVSMMIALDQKSTEKSMGAMRVGVIAHRHKDFNPDEKVIVLENKLIGKCYLDSKHYRLVDYKIIKED